MGYEVRKLAAFLDTVEHVIDRSCLAVDDKLLESGYSPDIAYKLDSEEKGCWPEMWLSWIDMGIF